MTPVVQFGSFELALDSCELRKQGVRIRLTDQAFRVLAILLERPGELISRDELRQRLWNDETFVDYDAGLNKIVNRLRIALSDSAGNPRFIETVARRGYRFLAPVTRAHMAGAGAGRAVGKVRLAVLPFSNLSFDAEQEFFSDGLTEEMISELGRLNPRRLGVIARTSVMLYKQSSKPIERIGKELQVDFVLEGSVRRAGSRVRITAQLIQCSDQTHLWAESYDRDGADVFQMQHEVARRVADSLVCELLSEPDASLQTATPEAHEAYLRGKFLLNKGSGRDALAAIACFEQCLALHPRYALACSAMAECYGRLGWFEMMPFQQAGAKAKWAAVLALQSNETLAEAHAARALACFWHEWNWPEAERSFRRAIELKPNYAAAQNWYAAFLNAMGRCDEAAVRQHIAEELDPLCLTIAMNGADPFFFSCRYASAIERLKAVLARDPAFFPAHYNLGRVYLQTGEYREAARAFERAAELSGVPQAHAELAYAYARLGELAKARAVFDELQRLAARSGVASVRFAWIHLGLGEFDLALDSLEQAFEEKSFWMIYLRADPIYQELRSHPRFVRLLDRLNF